MALRVTAIHSQQHTGPILGLSTACTGVQCQNGIIGIVFAGKHYLQLQFLQCPVNFSHISLHIFLNTFVLVIHANFPHNLNIVKLGHQGLVFIYAYFDIVQLLIDLLGLLRVVPKSRLAHFIF